MPSLHRIAKRYAIFDGVKRGALWTVWVTPVTAGENNIFFSSDGYLADGSKKSPSLHISFHRDGNAHIKNEQIKKCVFRYTQQDLFPICSVLTPLSDLVEMAVPPSKSQDLMRVPVKNYSQDDCQNWSELAFLHAYSQQGKNWRYSDEKLGFDLIDEVDIGQGRCIQVLHRYISQPSLQGYESIPQNRHLMPNARIVYAAYQNTVPPSLVVYDFSSERIKNSNFLSV